LCANILIRESAIGRHIDGRAPDWVVVGVKRGSINNVIVAKSDGASKNENVLAEEGSRVHVESDD
jgi:hypothetical protein